jgi:hypothetical protein
MKEGLESERKIMGQQGFLEKQEEVHYVMEKKERKKTKQKNGMNHVKRKKRRKKKNKNVNSSRQLV